MSQKNVYAEWNAERPLTVGHTPAFIQCCSVQCSGAFKPPSWASLVSASQESLGSFVVFLRWSLHRKSLFAVLFLLK